LISSSNTPPTFLSSRLYFWPMCLFVFTYILIIFSVYAKVYMCVHITKLFLNGESVLKDLSSLQHSRSWVWSLLFSSLLCLCFLSVIIWGIFLVWLEIWHNFHYSYSYIPSISWNRHKWYFLLLSFLFWICL
jgi:hypothetical protein